MGPIHRNRTLNCRGRLVYLDVPKVMGILNVTPDSFYDGGRYDRPGEAMRKVEQMVAEGADIIDVGGMSSRPGAAALDPNDERDRVLPVIREIHRAFPDVIISVDTVHAAVALAAADAGAGMVNDISAGTWDEGMLNAVAGIKLPYVLMHMKGKPQTMQQAPAYEDVALEVLDFLIERTLRCREAGITDLIVDPGLGFGKTMAHNYTLLNRLEVLDVLELPVLIGASRKSMIHQLLETTAEEALNGTTAVHMAALLKGADILRVHDVREAVECVRIYTALRSESASPGKTSS